MNSATDKARMWPVTREVGQVCPLAPSGARPGDTSSDTRARVRLVSSARRAQPKTSGPTKYRECERVKIHGGSIRKLTQREAEELAQHVQRLRDRLLPPILPDVPQ